MNLKERCDHGKKDEDILVEKGKNILSIEITPGNFGSERDRKNKIDGDIVFKDLYPFKKFSYDLKGFKGRGDGNFYVNAITINNEPYGILESLADLYIWPDEERKKYYCITSYIVKKFIIDNCTGLLGFNFMRKNNSKDQPHWYYGIEKSLLLPKVTFIIDTENNTCIETEHREYKWNNLEQIINSLNLDDFNKQFKDITFILKENKEKTM